MFDQLSDRFDALFKRLSGRGLLTEADVDAALREVRIALLEADVALPVIKRFMTLVKEKAVGEDVLKSIKPSEQVVKIVHDALVEVLGEGEELNLRAQPPVVLLMVGLQGSGKTTTTGKLARLLKNDRKKVLMASLDIYRPAAQAQLATLGQRTGVDSLEIIDGQKPLEITKRALDAAKKGGYDVLMLDTAGRLEIDEAMMAELDAVKATANPTEVLLVADAMTGQVAVDIATAFNERFGVTGIILTRMDGDSRGGAALSMREVTGKPIKYVGTGENLEGITPFHPKRVAGRILGMGDVVSLVEKMQENIDEEAALKMQDRMMDGKFDLNDLRSQLEQMTKMGSLSSLMDMMPGMKGMKDKIDPSKLDDRQIVRQIAIINSMTPKERRNPQLMNARRRIRIANGAGVSVNEVNKLLKSYDQMSRMMKKLGKMGGLAGLGKMFGKGGLPNISGMPKLPK
ncbi:MAG: signal recognition particle protein [Proteobacteria bacterium]|nr:signal recognition particle protein [Pseudomonadota bacterium]